MHTKRFFCACLFFLGVISIVLPSIVWAATTTDVLFSNHIQMKLPEQDVFVEYSTDKTMVIRVEGDTATNPETMAMKLYATKIATEHDPFKLGPTPLGPFEMGKSLGFTLEEWLAATGKGTYTEDGDTANISLTFEKLVPNGIYSVWCSRITFPPNATIVDKPCGAADGSENTFTADKSGNGTIFVKLQTSLEESTKETVSALVLAYHSDGKTYGASPGSFGLNSHVQLAYFLPAQEVIPATQNKKLGIYILFAILVVGSVWWLKKRPNDITL